MNRSWSEWDAKIASVRKERPGKSSKRDSIGSRSRLETIATQETYSTWAATLSEILQAAGIENAAHLIFRTSWVYGTRGGNFAKTMLRLAQERDSLNVINDQVGAPTGAELIADVTAHAIRTAQQR